MSTTSARPGPTSPPSPDSAPGASSAHVLLATADPLLRAEVTRLAAAGGCPLVLCEDPEQLRRDWRQGRAVLLGHDALDRLRGAGLPRRPEVHVLCPTAPTGDDLRGALALGASGVWELPGDTGRVAALLADLGEEDHRPGRVVGVVAGSGGVGASVLTVALATVAAESATALAVDLDPRGAGLEVLAGVGHDRTPGWDSLAGAHGRLNAGALRAALATGDGPAVLGWGTTGLRLLPAAPVVAESLAAARRGHDWAFVDSRSPDVWSGCDALVVLVAASVPGVAAAARTVQELPAGVPVGVAVRSRRHDRWAEDVARSLGLPLWTVVTRQRPLDDHLSAGLGPVRRGRSPLRRAAGDLLRELVTR